MSGPPLPRAEIETYIDPATLPYAFCPGCNHTLIVDKINEALVRQQLDPRDVDNFIFLFIFTLRMDIE